MNHRDLETSAELLMDRLSGLVDALSATDIYRTRFLGGNIPSLYWMSPLAEKNPLKTREFLWMTQAGAGAKPQGKPRGAVTDFLLSMAAIAQTVFRCLIVRMVMPRRRERFLDGSRTIFVTYFPYLDKQAATEGMFVNKYFAPLQDGREIDWVLMSINTTGIGFLRTALLARRFTRNGASIAFLEEFIGVLQLHRISLTMFYRFLTYVLARREVWYLMGVLVPVAAWRKFLHALVRRSFFGFDLLRSSFIYTSFMRIFGKCVNRNAKCVYLAEMQSWEAALCDAARSKGVRTYGYIHTPAARNSMLCRHGTIQMREMPLPDTILCDGPSAVEDMKAWGYKDVRLVESLRYGYLRDLPQRKASGGKPVLLVAGSIMREETAPLLEMLGEAILRLSVWEVWARGHPSLPIRAASGRVRLADGDIAQVLSETDVVLTPTSSLAAEALAAGCDVIVPVFDSFLGLDILEGRKELYRKIYDAEELVSTLGWNKENGMWASHEAKEAFKKEYWCLDKGTARWDEILGDK